MNDNQNNGSDSASSVGVTVDDPAGISPAVAPPALTDAVAAGAVDMPLEESAASPVESGVQPTNTPLSAQDGELIEKEWVHKAKEIVEGTQMDPYTQSKQINHVKADYIKKRYGRDVQTDE